MTGLARTAGGTVNGPRGLSLQVLLCVKGRFLATLALAALASSACTTLSVRDCEMLDWRTQGKEDGTNGHPRHHYHQHQSQCAEHGISGDPAAYEAGWELGVVDYCSRTNGFYEGREGHFYHGICPPELEHAFIDAYREGKRLRRIDREIVSLERAIDHREDRLADENLSSQERGRLRRKLRELDRAYRRLTRELVRAEARYGF